jgi:hypothetical protein
LNPLAKVTLRKSGGLEKPKTNCVFTQANTSDAQNKIRNHLTLAFTVLILEGIQ